MLHLPLLFVVNHLFCLFIYLNSGRMAFKGIVLPEMKKYIIYSLMSLQT